MTLQEGLAMQLQLMNHWKLRLNEACFDALQERVTCENEKLTEKSAGEAVFRGQDLDTFIQNWKP